MHPDEGEEGRLGPSQRVDHAALAAAIAAAVEYRGNWQPLPACPAACNTLQDLAARWLLTAVAIRGQRDGLRSTRDTAVERARLTRQGWAWHVAAQRCSQITVRRVRWLLAWLGNQSADPVVGPEYVRARAELAVWLVAFTCRAGAPPPPYRHPRPIPAPRRRPLSPPAAPGDDGGQGPVPLRLSDRG